MPVGTSSARVLASSWWRCRCGSGEAGSKFSDELEGFRVGGSPESHAAGKEPSDPLGAEFAMIWSRRNGFIELGFPGAVGPLQLRLRVRLGALAGIRARGSASSSPNRLLAAQARRRGQPERAVARTGVTVAHRDCQWQWQLASEFEPRKPRESGSEAQVYWHRDRQ